MSRARRARVGESDSRLMRRVQSDETEAFELLYDRHAARAFRIALSICHDTGRAQDAVQEAFLDLWRNRMRFRSSGSFHGWISRSARNRAIDSLRRERTRPRMVEEGGDRIDPCAPSVPAQAIARADAGGLRTLLGRLPEAQSEVIALAFFGHMSHSEIARQLSLPAGTVKGRMRLGLEKLASELEAEGASACAPTMPAD